MRFSLFLRPACRDSKYFRYNGALDLENFLSFLNKILHPYVELDQEETIKAFVDASVQFNETTDFFANGFRPLPF